MGAGVGVGGAVEVVVVLFLLLAPHFKKGRAKLCRGCDFTGA